jgi:hypothetical protein
MLLFSTKSNWTLLPMQQVTFRVFMRRSQSDQTSQVPVPNLAVQAATERRQDMTFGWRIAPPAQLELEAFKMAPSLSNR